MKASTRPTGTVTFLFTDIEGSTRGWETDAAAMRAAFARQEAIIRHAVEANGGYAYKMVGDAFQAAFPTAPQALQAAIDAQVALHSETRPAGTGDTGEKCEVKVRMALHTGVTEERGDDYVGPILNRAARLLSAGHGAQILLSEVTQRLVQDDLPTDVWLLDMGQHRLKDLTRSEHIFQAVAPGLPSEFPPLKTLDNRPNNLPLQPTPLIGRERELAELGKLLASEQVRLLTLTGAGGTGKTRLGLQVASELLDDYPGGVWFVDLATLTDAALVPSAIAQTLRLREAPGKTVVDTLCDYLADKQILMVLDNFEQVMDASEAVTALVKRAPRTNVLVTSRAKLNIYGEHEYEVPPLALPDAGSSRPGGHPAHLPPLPRLMQYEAVALFVERAQAAKAAVGVNNDNAPAVAEICIRLDGLPLAIELAAPRVRVLPPQALLARLSGSLSGSLRLLTGGARDLSSRQHTLRGTIDWSYNLLSDEEKQLFARMAVFQGSCTLQSLDVVCNYDGNLQIDVLDGAQSLLDKSLLRQREGHDGEPCFRMLGIIQEYAREKLAEVDSSNGGQEEELRREHALYYMRLAEEAEPHLAGAERQKWLDKLEEEHDNIRAALLWATTQGLPAVEIGLRIGAAIGRFWHLRGYYSEGREQLSELLELAKVAEEREADNARSQTMTEGVDGQWSLEVYKARALQWAGHLATLQGDNTSARSLLEEALSIQRELGEKEGMAYSLIGLGTVAFEQGEHALARSLFEESLALRREVGDKQGSAISLNNLGVVAKEQGDYPLARALLEESLSIARELGEKLGVGYALGNLALMDQEQEDYATARALYEESLALFRELGNKWAIAMALAGLGGVQVGSAADARRAGATGRNGAGEPDEPGVTSATNDLKRGASLLGAVDVQLQSLGAVLATEDRRPYERAIAQARAALGEEEFEQAWAQGRIMSMEEAIEYAVRNEV